MITVIRISSTTLLLFMLTACGTLYKLDVSAYNSGEAEPGSTYIIFSGNPDLNTQSEVFSEYADQLERALLPLGYQRLKPEQISEAELGFYIIASIDEPERVYHTVSTPIMETVRDESVIQQTSANNSQTGSQNSTQPNTVYDSSTVDMVSGKQETPFARTVYTKHLSIIATNLQQYLYEASTQRKENTVPRQIWSVEVKTTGSPSNLRTVVPVMITAASSYFQKTTNDIEQVRLSENDQRIKRIRTSH